MPSGSGGAAMVRAGIAEQAVARLSETARGEDVSRLQRRRLVLAALYRAGFKRLAHGPMPSDIKRQGGDAAVERALRYLVDGAPETLEPTVTRGSLTAAFNITILSHLSARPSSPTSRGTFFFSRTSPNTCTASTARCFTSRDQPSIRRVAGIKLGRCSEIPANDPDFGETEEGSPSTGARFGHSLSRPRRYRPRPRTTRSSRSDVCRRPLHKEALLGVST